MERNRNRHRLCLSWISFNLDQIDGNPLSVVLPFKRATIAIA